MKWIHAAYRIFKSSVKPQARKMRLWNNEKGESIGLDSPFELGYDLDIQIVFDVIIHRIMTINPIWHF
jgi:hypothetical protein